MASLRVARRAAAVCRPADRRAADALRRAVHRPWGGAVWRAWASAGGTGGAGAGAAAVGVPRGGPAGAGGAGGLAAGGGGVAGFTAPGGGPFGGCFGFPSGPSSSLACATTIGALCACDTELANCIAVRAVVASSTRRSFVMVIWIPEG